MRFRCDLWPGDDGSHKTEIDRFFAGSLKEPQEVLVAADDDRLMGVAELSIRSHAEGCSTDHVGYLEGWYVVPEYRRQGVGRALLEASERWARNQGCTEFASDAAIDNDTSRLAHQAYGFVETGLIRCFRKEL